VKKFAPTREAFVGVIVEQSVGAHPKMQTGRLKGLSSAELSNAAFSVVVERLKCEFELARSLGPVFS
jgi:hypothetical protein